MQVSESYGVLIPNSDKTDAGIALRGLFLINPEGELSYKAYSSTCAKPPYPREPGVVEQSTVNNLPVGRSVSETLRLIKAFQVYSYVPLQRQVTVILTILSAVQPRAWRSLPSQLDTWSQNNEG